MMKKLLASVLAAAMSISLLALPASAAESKAAAPNLTGVSDWAKPGVNAAYEAGLIPTLTGTPAYQDAITREQFAELAVQTVTVLCGKAPDAANTAAFVDSDNPNVLEAAAAGIVSGVGDGRFDPKTTTNREQIATMIASAITYINREAKVNLAPDAADLSKFSDKDQVSAWAVAGVGTLAANGIMSGTSATTLSPKAPCTVEQSVLLLYQVYVAKQGKPSDPTGTPDSTKVVYYKDFPQVPDFGAYFGCDDTLQDITDKGDGSFLTLYQYTLTENIGSYGEVLYDAGFFWVMQFPNSMTFRNPDVPDLRIDLFIKGLGANQVALGICDTSDMHTPVSPLTFYPEGTRVPDFAAATGWTPLKRIDAYGGAQYTYRGDDATLDKHYFAWCDQLLQEGYRLMMISDTNLSIWVNESAGWCVQEGFTPDGSAYVVGIVPTE